MLPSYRSGTNYAAQPTITWADLAGETFLVRHGGTGPQVHDHIVPRLAGRWPAPSILRFDVGRGMLMSMVGQGFGTRVGWLATFVQIAGGCYLIYLGLSAWFSRTAKTLDGAGSPNITSAARGFRMGLIVELSNPKGIAFFVSFFAVAVPMETALWVKAVILAGGFILEIVWYGAASFLLSTRPVRAVYERFAIWIERAIGTPLAGFGVRLISEKL